MAQEQSRQLGIVVAAKTDHKMSRSNQTVLFATTLGVTVARKHDFRILEYLQPTFFLSRFC